MNNSDKIILGIDPGTTIMGYGIIEINGIAMKLVAAGVIDLSKIDDHHLKLKKIFERSIGLIEEYHPDEFAVEAPFFGKNVQSMLKLGRAQGIAIAAALSRNIPVFEYLPRKIKQSITGNGNASKEQVAAMLQTLLKFSEQPKFLDATDGLAAAVCHHFQSNNKSAKQKGFSGWKAFIAENPGRKLSS
ncbi:MAG: crossover junction endodeoxyribonuclease RuvC [Bacteroidetes bacterium]|nr:crossover junction endodeoxyribonuclease RuvC [Bacteroidota bacterium]